MDSPTLTADAAGTWPLGGLTVNRLGFGAMRLPRSLSEDGAPAGRGQPVAVLRRAVELGVNHIDTAAFYFSALRSANELINTALAPYPDGVLIATKVGPGRDTWGAWQGMALAIAPVTAVQNRYSIDSRRPEADDVLRACAERGIAFVPFFAIAGEGREDGRPAGELESVLAVARAHGATPAQVRLAWTLAQGPHVLAIPAPAASPTSPRTWRPAHCASPARSWPS